MNRTDTKIDRIFEKLEKIENNTAILPDIKADVKENTEFRIKSTGIIGFVAFVCTALGSLIMWIATRFSK